MTRLQTVDDATFDDFLTRTPGLVAVDFTAAWCGPCRILTPLLEQIAAESTGSLTVATLDADENPATASRFGVRSLPTILFFRGGQLVGRSVGAIPKPMLQAKITATLEAVEI